MGRFTVRPESDHEDSAALLIAPSGTAIFRHLSAGLLEDLADALNTLDEKPAEPENTPPRWIVVLPNRQGTDTVTGYLSFLDAEFNGRPVLVFTSSPDWISDLNEADRYYNADAWTSIFKTRKAS